MVSEKRLGNLTFSFHNSARDPYESPRRPPTNGENNKDAITTNIDLNTKKLILDENNLQGLFNRARSIEKLNVDEIEDNVDEFSEQAVPPKSSAQVMQHELAFKSETVPQDTFSSIGLHKSPTLTNTSMNGEADQKQRTAPTANGGQANSDSLFVQQVDSEFKEYSQKAWDNSLDSTEFVNGDIKSPDNDFSSYGSHFDHVQTDTLATKSNNSLLIENGWVPKSEHLKMMLQNGREEMEKDSKNDSKGSISYEEKNKGVQQVVPNSFSYRDKEEISSRSAFYSKRFDMNTSNDKPFTEMNQNNEVVNNELLKNNKGFLFQNVENKRNVTEHDKTDGKSMVDAHIAVSTQYTSGLMSFDAVKEERRLNYKKEWKSRHKKQAENLKMSHEEKVGDIATHDTQYYEWNNLTHPQFNNSNNIGIKYSSPAKNKLPSKHRSHGTTGLEGKFLKQDGGHSKLQHQQVVSFENQEKSFRKAHSMNITASSVDFAYSKTISRVNSDDVSSSLDDGYGSETHRTNASSTASEFPIPVDMSTLNENGEDFITSLTNKVNLDLQEELVIVQENVQNVEQQAPNDLSNLHEILNEPEIENKDEELNKRNSIHSKLDDLLKAKMRSLNEKTVTNQKQPKTFPDSFLSDTNASESNDLVESSLKNNHEVARYTSIEKTRVDEIDGPTHGDKMYVQRGRFSADDVEQLQNKQSLMRELRRAVSRRTSIAEEDNEQTKLQTSNDNITEQNDSTMESSNNKVLSLYDSFPLKLSPAQKRKEIDLTDSAPTHNFISNRQTDEEPIDKPAVQTMLASHLSDKPAVQTMLASHLRDTKGLNSQSKSQEITLRSSKGKQFSFTSKDLKNEETTAPVKGDMMDELEKTHKRLSLGSAEDTENISQHSFNRNRAHTIATVTLFPEDLSLTESEFSSIKNNNTPVTQSTDHSTNTGSMLTEIQIHRSTSTQNVSLSVKEADVSNAAVSKIDFPIKNAPVPASKAMNMTEVEHASLEPIVASSLSSQSKTKEKMIIHRTQVTPRSDTGETSSTQKQNELLTTQTESQEKRSNISDFTIKPAIPLGADSFRTKYYLPEDNEESVIRPSEYRVHNFKDRSKYRQPSPSQPPAPLKIDVSKLDIQNLAGAKRGEKRTAPRSLNTSQEEVKMDVSMEEFEDNISNANTNTSTEGNWSKELETTEIHEKWINTPYTKTNIGKLTIPQTFQPKYQNGIFNMDEFSSQSGTPKKQRRFSAASSNSTSSIRIGAKFKQLFSPSLKRNVKKQEPFDSSSSGAFSPRSNEDIARRKNMNTNAWGLNDDNVSVSGGFYDNSSVRNGFDDDNIDTDFVSNEEWIDSHRSSFVGSMPQIKAPIIPEWKTKQTQRNHQKNIGRVNVPKIFSKQNGFFQHSERRKSQSYKASQLEVERKILEENQLQVRQQLISNDVALNSFDINNSRKPKSYQPIIFSKSD